MRVKKHIKIFALAAQGVGISGSDRIFIELARRWQKKATIEIITWNEGHSMISKQDLESRKSLKITSLNIILEKYTLINYFTRIIKSIHYGCTAKLEDPANTILYNASEFWMDSLPCVILKIRYPKATWIATWYQTAPNPLIGFSEKSRQERHRYKAFLYWFVQQPIRLLIQQFADKVIVNNESERKRFTHKETIVLIGAVPLQSIENFKEQYKGKRKLYDAVFQGRFHAQKGVSELIDIWREVVKSRPEARLAMIGDGPEMPAVKQKIKKYKLDNNIELFGYMFDSDEKFEVFAQSKIVVHPAYYDSGGMASAEAMAFGLPCVGFNLSSYKSYYPKGMLKAKDEKEFVKTILKLLKNTQMRNKTGKEAKELIYGTYSWNNRAEEIFTLITQ